MKKLTAVLVLLLAAVMLFSCGGEGAGDDTSAVSVSAVVREPKAIGAALAERCTFSEPLTENDVYLETHPFSFVNDTVAGYEAYVAQSVSTEEIFVFEMKSEADAGAMTDRLEAYVEKQRSDFSKYAPGEVPKLEGAVIRAYGNFVIYVVSADNDAAAKVTADMMK